MKDKLVDGKFQGPTAVNSARMRAVKAKGNKSTEARLRSMLVRAGIRGWKLHLGNIVGKPDFYFPERKVAVFVDGCFWHGCPRCGHVPKANHPYWKAKIERNVQRDRANNARLNELGISVLRFWEHELRLEPRQVVQRTRHAIGSFKRAGLPSPGA